MTYRAVPVAALFKGMTVPPDSVIEAIALDGFIAQLPLDLVLNSDESKAVAGSRSSLRIIPGRQFWRKIRALARSTSFGPVLRSEAFAASNGRSKWRSW